MISGRPPKGLPTAHLHLLLCRFQGAARQLVYFVAGDLLIHEVWGQRGDLVLCFVVLLAGLLGFVQRSELVGNSYWGEVPVGFVAVFDMGIHLANAKGLCPNPGKTNMV